MSKNALLTLHRINPLNEALKVRVMDEPGPSGACSIYAIYTEADPEKKHHEQPPLINQTLRFHRGDPAKGVTGISVESLLAIAEHQLTGWGEGPLSSAETATAADHVRKALTALGDRAARVAREKAAAALAAAAETTSAETSAPTTEATAN